MLRAGVFVFLDALLPGGHYVLSMAGLELGAPATQGLSETFLHASTVLWCLG